MTSCQFRRSSSRGRKKSYLGSVLVSYRGRMLFFFVFFYRMNFDLRKPIVLDIFVIRGVPIIAKGITIESSFLRRGVTNV